MASKVFRASFSLSNTAPVLSGNVSVHSSKAMTSKVRKNFLSAMQRVYGPFEGIGSDEAKKWTPPPALDGHRGRYLWTDAFGVLNFLTLFKEMSEPKYLALAERLIFTVHDILGRNRDGITRLPGATDSHPLSGGLRIGKNEEHGREGDGQYHHYLTLWMFALNRFSIASGDKTYNDLSIQLAKAIHPHFVYDRNQPRPRMYWKMSVDLTEPLVTSEGGLDPIDGFVVFSLLQETAGDKSVLAEEISDYERIVMAKYDRYSTEDPLDLGMSMWTCHFFRGEATWADVLNGRLLSDLRDLMNESGYFSNPHRYRLAFREFGMCLGMQCQTDMDLYTKAIEIISSWEEYGAVPVPASEKIAREISTKMLPISQVMYAAALFPGAFKKGYFGTAN